MKWLLSRRLEQMLKFHHFHEQMRRSLLKFDIFNKNLLSTNVIVYYILKVKKIDCESFCRTDFNISNILATEKTTKYPLKYGCYQPAYNHYSNLIKQLHNATQ